LPLGLLTRREGAPWAVCISQSPHQYIYSSNSFPTGNNFDQASMTGEISRNIYVADTGNKPSRCSTWRNGQVADLDRERFPGRRDLELARAEGHVEERFDFAHGTPSNGEGLSWPGESSAARIGRPPKI
jgi:hypothetical protein